MAMHFAAPRPFMLVLPSTSSMKKRIIITCCGNKPNLAHDTSRSKKFKINVAEPQMKNKATEERSLEVEQFNWTILPSGKLDENIVDIFNGKLLQDGLVFQQNFLIRSYELGPDCKISIGALINHLHESALNHFKSAGLVAEGFGSTRAMSEKNLIWVVYKMQIMVDSYPSWADVVQVDTWTCASGRNGMRRDWLGRDYKTGKNLFRAVSVYVMMNKKTRKLSKFIKETREETKAVFMDCDPIIDEDGRKLRGLNFDTADYVRTGLSPQWADLDLNQHVNHVKYIDWILESVPNSVLETHELRDLRLEFRRECGKNSLLQSLSSVSKEAEEIELQHTLHLENGSEILRGRTIWTPRN